MVNYEDDKSYRRHYAVKKEFCCVGAYETKFHFPCKNCIPYQSGADLDKTGINTNDKEYDKSEDSDFLMWSGRFGFFFFFRIAFDYRRFQNDINRHCYKKNKNNDT